MSIIHSYRFKLTTLLFALFSLFAAVLAGMLIYMVTVNQSAEDIKSEQATLYFLGQNAKAVLMTRDYTELQLLAVNLVSDPHISTVMVMDSRARVVVSSSYQNIGETLQSSEFSDADWKQQRISNVNEDIIRSHVRDQLIDYENKEESSIKLGLF